MSLFQPTSPRHLSIGLTVMRVITGIIFAAHGAQKLFVFGVAGVTGGFSQMGIPMADLVAPVVALLEFVGGIALVIGLLTRVVSLGLAIDMLGAILFVHLAKGFFLPNGVEFVLALLGSSLALVLTGAGAFSLDALLARRRDADAAAAPPVEAGSRRAA